MSVEIREVRLCRAYKSYEDWMNEDPVLLYGEFGIAFDVPDYDQVRLKAGDGIHKFSELPWYGNPDVLDSDQVNVPRGAVQLDSRGLVPLELIPDELLNKQEEVEE